MKKIALFVSVAVIAGLSLTSCKKEYACSCTTGSFTATSTYTKLNKADGETFEKNCNAGTNSSLGITCKTLTQ